jgi:hypothetical protein
MFNQTRENGSFQRTGSHRGFSKKQIWSYNYYMEVRNMSQTKPTKSLFFSSIRIMCIYWTTCFSIRWIICNYLIWFTPIFSCRTYKIRKKELIFSFVIVYSPGCFVSSVVFNFCLLSLVFDLFKSLPLLGSVCFPPTKKSKSCFHSQSKFLITLLFFWFSDERESLAS